MGTSLNCSCKNSDRAFDELVSTPRCIIKNINGEISKCATSVTERRLESNNIEFDVIKPIVMSGHENQIIRIPADLNSEVLIQFRNLDSGKISTTQDVYNHLEQSLEEQMFTTVAEMLIPQQVVEGLKMVGEISLDPKLIKMFKDCQKQEPVKLDNQGGIYEGQWSHSIRNGYGKLLYEDHSYYEGFWVNNERHFDGIFVDQRGDAYVQSKKYSLKQNGQWFSNQMHGEGKLYKRDGTLSEIHSGFQNRSKKYKTSKDPSIIYPDGKLYYGDLSEGQRHGFGLFIQSDKTEFIGNYKNDKQDGLGFLAYEDGRTFQGSWIEGSKNGLGEYSWPNGQFFVGNYQNDTRDGYGMFIYPNGQIYRGQFQEGDMTGKGRMVDIKGKCIEAQWVKGKRTRQSKLEAEQFKLDQSKLRDQILEEEINNNNNLAQQGSSWNVSSYTHNPWA